MYVGRYLRGVAQEEGTAQRLLAYDELETLGDRYPGFNTRVGGRVDLDATACLRGVLPFRPHDAPWMAGPLSIHITTITPPSLSPVLSRRSPRSPTSENHMFITCLSRVYHVFTSFKPPPPPRVESKYVLREQTMGPWA